MPSDAPDDPVSRVAAALAARHPHVMLPDLTRMRALVDLLGNPQRAYPSIHLTGTNGKTSTARMIDALLRAHDLRTGRYTSPHLESVTERIAIDGEPIAPERLGEVWDEIAPLIRLVDESHPEQMTFFEVGTALAFAAFADAPVDVAVVEVGLGGTWDATNVIDAGTAVITTVDLDHTEMLGDTVGEIAAEKAGIVHAGATLVLAAQHPDAAAPILARVAEVGARVVAEGSDLAVLDRRVAVGGQLLTLATRAATYEDLLLPLHGAHQAHNALLALAAVESFLGGRALDADVVRAGFAAADSPGRLEVVRTGPTIVLDGAHNPAGARALRAAIEEAFSFGRLIAVVGMLADKDAVGFLEGLGPVVDHVIVTEPRSPRALPADDLAAIAADVLGEDAVSVAGELPDAIDRAVAEADVAFAETGEAGGVGVLITGSLVTVGEARTLLRH
ncbi:MAG TPA: folylpolyglutamate synthase/dihydrofolate synthase family protein [Mycobacteriales bacterium]